ncbi:MAG TPA: hypothetical protein VFU48_04690 [Nitrospira sp.]|nr:hypothetical protein [Nitrospira sp.]
MSATILQSSATLILHTKQNELTIAYKKSTGSPSTVKAAGTHLSGIEGVPRIPTGARPLVVLTRRPTAQWTPDAWFGRVAALVEGGFTITYGRCWAHAQIL